MQRYYHTSVYNLGMDYNQWNDLQNEMNQRRTQAVKDGWRRRALYFRRQRFLGLFIMGVGLIALLTSYLANMPLLGYAGIVIALVGLYIALSKHMIIIDEYYLECQSRMNLY